ncbi:MAG TPA: LCP family protein [Mycobacterium sp.]|nr:LCP family protein [Mycobacterium sp.]
MSVLVVLGAATWITYRDVWGGITTSSALDGVSPSTGPEQNILLMGLDSRRDQQGRPLDKEVLEAMHAGDETSGSYDADVLIVVHVPEGDGPITAISIPRDDYVELPGCPTSDCQGKIKAAYRLAYESEKEAEDTGDDPTATPSTNAAADEQMAREAGRRAQINAVKDLLQIPIDHFVEITLGAFFQIARVVEPIKVCLNADTSDRYYSGADFHAGTQEIDAAQAMSFVRQRRDANDVLFTDLDRTRRQQAFIASVVAALRDGDTLSNPAKLKGLLEVAKQNLAVDSGLDLGELIPFASAAIDRPAEFYTLPVVDFRTLPDGEDVNIIDTAEIRAITHKLVSGGDPSAASSASTVAPASAHRVTLDVVNAAGRDGVAAAVQNALAKDDFAEGSVDTAGSVSATSSIAYGNGARSAAEQLANETGISVVASDAVAPDTVLLTVGTDFDTSGYVDGLASTADATTTQEAPDPTTVAATAVGEAAPTPTNLTVMNSGSVPCVR